MRKLLALVLLSGAVSHLLAQQRPAITGIAFVRVYSSDAAATENFYGRTLGYSFGTIGNITHYSVGPEQWIETVPLPNPAPRARLAAVGFRTVDARGLEKYLKAHRVEIVDPLKNGRFSVHDPEGNLIFFVQQVKAQWIEPPHPDPAVSRRIIHTGFVVKDEAAENRFYREILGFRPYWRGGRTDTSIDYVSQQVPEGSDWLEYMLNVPAGASAKQLGSSDHMSLGVEHMPDAIAALARNGCEGPNCTASKTGRDGKVQLNLFDPDLTRVEYMEFKPSGTTCCSQFTAAHPTATGSR
ncbi:MAG: VOC family protein [Acidobacteria bacterium]|nr:VOC family protein [Acidobacteriota bacterium]